MSEGPLALLAGPQHILEAAPFPIMRAGVDGMLKYANSAASLLVKAWQCEPGESLPEPAYSLVRAAVVSGHSGSVEYSFGDRVFALRCGPVDKHGVPLYATDISGIIHAETVMVESGEMLIGILSAAPLVLISVDEDRKVSVYADAGMSALNGETSTVADLLPNQPELTTAVETAFSGKISLPTSLIATTEDDRVFSLNISGVRDESGDVVRLLITGMDVTERQRHVKQIEEREAQYRSIFDTVGDGLVILSASGRIVDANPSACTLFRTNIGAFIGRRMQAFVHPEGHEFLRSTRRLLKSGRRSKGELTAIRSDGQTFDADVVVAPFNYRGDRHILAVVRDVSEQRANQRALEELNQSLESLVAERTYALKASRDRLDRQSRELADAYRELQANHTQLAHSEKMASIGQLAAGVAHEINNPVGYVSSNLRTLGEYVALFREAFTIETLDPKVTEALTDADAIIAESLDGASRVAEIVDGLKRFARADDDSTVESNLNDLIRTTLKVLHNQLKYDCTVDLRLAELPPVNCRPGQINQVLMNLITNARQAITERGTITISTSVETRMDEQIVRLSVKDNGSGIKPENLTRLFNPFFTTKPVGEGTGLGLSISYSIIKEHSGSISVESEEGVGTTFTITLPVAKASAPSDSDSILTLSPIAA